MNWEPYNCFYWRMSIKILSVCWRSTKGGWLVDGLSLGKYVPTSESKSGLPAGGLSKTGLPTGLSKRRLLTGGLHNKKDYQLED